MGFAPTEQVEESQPRDWNPAHKADERMKEAPGMGFAPTEQVEESQPRDWNPAHKADEKTKEAPGMGFAPTEQVEESQPRDWNPAHKADQGSQAWASLPRNKKHQARASLHGTSGRIPTKGLESRHKAEEKTQEENFCQQQWLDEPTQGRVEEIHDMDLDDVGEPEEGGQGDQQMEDAPPAHQTSPYLFRKPRRYAMNS
ncbi:hypothetical protein PDIDSM_5286 [Penicillium digitatum]|nr:hypothetical protein PDIDSM_5286 [Penicillium digitatum]